MKHARQITLTDDERRTLDRWTRGRRTPARLVLRAKIVLLAADEMMNKDIADSLATARKRFRCGARGSPNGDWRASKKTRRAADERRKRERESPARSSRKRLKKSPPTRRIGVREPWPRRWARRPRWCSASGLPTNSNRIGPRRSRSATIRILPRSCLTWWGCISILPNTLWCFARTKRLRSKRWIGRNAGCRFIEAVVAR